MNLDLLPKVGTKVEKLLNKLNIYTIEDLLQWYPYKYDIIKFVDIKDAIDNSVIYIRGKVITMPKITFIKKNLNKMDFFVDSNGTTIKVTIFNRAFYKRLLYQEREIIVTGKYNKLRSSITASNIKFQDLEEKIESIYHLTEGIKQNTIQTLITESLKANVTIDDYIPKYYIDKYKFISKEKAIQLIHKPQNIENIKQSRLRLIYEELFIYMFKIHYLKTKTNNLGLAKNYDENLVQDFLSSLNFKLTTDQEKVIKEILTELKTNKKMNRLILGDVGTGKTIVAIIAMLANHYAGYQSAFMAPTEILARQHYESLKEYYKYTDINIALVVGSQSAREKNNLIKSIKEGSINVIVGTHALLNEKITFSNLGLVVIDEQHRFGVNQRLALQNKALNVDALYLSATPIPRTYALTIYGDLDLSQIKTKPKMRKSVITKVVPEQDIKKVLFSMLEELKKGHQIFVVSPLIEKEEENSLNSINKLYEKLNLAFNKKVKIEVLHGKLKNKEKENIMQEFITGKTKILISTTVIEVGIDVSNASTIVIFNAERFGLATLHQLRGRVGRGSAQGYCFLVTSDNDNQRLMVMEKSTDGFFIAEEDFKQRGSGDLFGIRQSGTTDYKLADIQRDYKILKQASIDSKDFVDKKEYLKDAKYLNLIDNIGSLD